MKEFEKDGDTHTGKTQRTDKDSEEEETAVRRGRKTAEIGRSTLITEHATNQLHHTIS